MWNVAVAPHGTRRYSAMSMPFGRAAARSGMFSQ
jgi:hypothetical protein